MPHSPAIRFARGGVVAIMLYGCGEDPVAAPQPPPFGAPEAGAPLGAGVAPVTPALDAAAAQPDAGLGGPSPAPDAGGGITLGGVDASTPPADASPPSQDTGPIVLTIPTRSVPCGGGDCTTTNHRTCCQAWSRGVGFEGTPSCTTLAACEAEHPPFLSETNRAVVSECDEPADCGGGQACCFVRYGMPIFADLFSTEVVGPGASRLCLNLSACNAGMGMFSGVLGIPVGMVACKTDADCAASGAASCVPEPADGLTTGMGAAPRPGVMVCR